MIYGAFLCPVYKIVYKTIVRPHASGSELVSRVLVTLKAFRLPIGGLVAAPPCLCHSWMLVTMLNAAPISRNSRFYRPIVILVIPNRTK
jgi:hypothetical protein